MTETVVHVTTLEQWKSVLDVWFAQGYEWFSSGQDYRENTFNDGSRQLALNIWGDDEITCFLNNDYHGDNLIEYADFMAQQKEEPDANREVTIVFQNGEMKSFIGVTDISLNNGILTFNYPQGDYGNTIMEATFYTDTISGYLIDTL